jgi:hypothetical protein
MALGVARKKHSRRQESLVQALERPRSECVTPVFVTPPFGYDDLDVPAAVAQDSVDSLVRRNDARMTDDEQTPTHRRPSSDERLPVVETAALLPLPDASDT